MIEAKIAIRQSLDTLVDRAGRSLPEEANAFSERLKGANALYSEAVQRFKKGVTGQVLSPRAERSSSAEAPETTTVHSPRTPSADQAMSSSRLPRITCS
mgnify:CR=1 FL=1